MKTPLALLCAAALASPASAVDWNNLGARSVGMGGTGVAVPQGPADNYWNPANLGAVDSKTGFHLPLTAHFGLTGSMIEGANDLDELSKRSAASITQPEIDAALAKLGASGNGVRGDVGAGFDFKFGRWAVFLNGFGYMGATPSVDRVNTTAANIADDTNNSKLIVRGASVSEFGVGHGRELPIEGLFVGGNLKVMSAKVGYADAFILREDQEFGDLFDRMTTATKQSANIGVDLGALWDLERSYGSMPLRPRLGLTGRNLNNPSFKQSDAAIAAGRASKFRMNPQLRFGASIQPLSWWTVATDLDLTRNLTLIDGVASRQWGLGSEFNLVNREAFNIPLRVGLLRNLADGRSGTMVTFGAGLNLAHFHVDGSLALSPKRVKTQSVGESEEFPREAMVGISLGLLFGGSREEVHRPGASPSPSGSSEPARDEQPVSSDKVRESMEKAQKELDKEAEKSR